MTIDAPKQDTAADTRGRLAVMQITPDTSKTLAAFWPHVQSALPDILNGFYRHMGAEPTLARLIGTQTERLKRAQGTHWERLFSGRFDAGYFDSVHAVGLVHAKIGLEQRWYIGDTVDDARCAREAGVPFIGIAAPANPRYKDLVEVLNAEKAVAVLDDINQLEAVVNS